MIKISHIYFWQHFITTQARQAVLGWSVRRKKLISRCLSREGSVTCVQEHSETFHASETHLGNQTTTNQERFIFICCTISVSVAWMVHSGLPKAGLIGLATAHRLSNKPHSCWWLERSPSVLPISGACLSWFNYLESCLTKLILLGHSQDWSTFISLAWNQALCFLFYIPLTVIIQVTWFTVIVQMRFSDCKSEYMIQWGNYPPRSPICTKECYQFLKVQFGMSRAVCDTQCLHYVLISTVWPVCMVCMVWVAL